MPQLSIPDMLANFESLGNNCEFGIVQRAADYDPPGLFRNAGFLLTEQMIHAVEASFAGMFDEGRYVFSRPAGWPDCALDCRVFGFQFHTGIPNTETDERVFAKAIGLFRFLKRKLLEDLQDAQKIFVYRHNEAAQTSDDMAGQLLSAMRRHGPNWLLLVREDARPERRFAWAEAAGDGLIHAGISRLSKENPPYVDFAAWEKIARIALALKTGQSGSAEFAATLPRHLAAEGAILHPLPAQAGLASRGLLELQCEGLPPGSLYTAEAEVYVPSGFSGTSVDLTMLGYPSENYRIADLARRDCWQPVAVSASVPEASDRAVPVLSATYRGADGMWLASRGWRLRGGPSRRRYRAVTCDELLAMAPGARIAERHADIDVELAPIRFGQTAPPDFPIVEYPADGWRPGRIVAREQRTLEIDDAVIHGEQGLVTVGEYLLKETLRLVSLGDQKVAFEPDEMVSLETFEPRASIGFASYLFCGYPGNRNYAHWMVDILPAAAAPFVDQVSTLVWPKLRHPWQEQSLALLNERHRSVFLEPLMPVRCEKLRVSPLGVIDSGHFPHPDRLHLLARLQEIVGFDPAARRRIYVSRRDSSVRRLLNEDAVIDALGTLGFEILTLTGMPVAQQIRCFAEAVCVVGPHGAGLANVAFCQPGAVFCELLMDNYVQWSMRRLASVVPLRYGCVLGRELGSAPGQHQKAWTVDVAEVRRAVLAALGEG